MKTKASGSDGPGTRGAWTYAPVQAPTFADFRAGGERRSAFLRYWITDNVQNALDLTVHFGLRLVPIDWASGAGAALSRFAVPRWHGKAMKRARDNMRRLRPEMTKDALDAAVRRNFDNQGRLMTEFSVLERLMPSGRVTLHDMEPIAAAAAAGPMILFCVHLGNWEVLAPAVRSVGITPNANWVPTPSRARTWIANRVRRRIGVKLMPPGAAGARPAIRILKAGGTVSMFADEAFKGRSMAPFFGRPLHLAGNLAVAVRLVRHTGATISPAYVLRRDGCRFEVHGLPPIRLAPEETPGSRLAEDVAMLNAVFEPVVRANLDQWYFLDKKL